MKKFVMGIDVGKERLAFCVKSGDTIVKGFVVENTLKRKYYTK